MFLIVIASVMLAVGLNNILQVLDVAKYSEAYQEAVKTFYAPSFWKQILFTGIFIPIIEEILFRGIAFRILRKWLPFVWTMLITAFLFGIYHGNLVQFIYAMLCGLFLAYLCEKLHAVWASIVAHISMNVLACTMTKFEAFNWIFENAFRVAFVTTFCLVIFGVSIVCLQKLDVTEMLKKDCKS